MARYSERPPPGEQGLVASYVERPPGITAPTHDAELQLPDGGTERLVAGWQVTIVLLTCAFLGSTALLLSRHCCSGQAAIAATTLPRQGPTPVQVLPRCKAGFKKPSLAPISSKTTLRITTADFMWLPPAQSADFVIASLSAGCELRRFPCGGLHRPFALRLGPSADYTFVFHKGDRLHIHRSAPQAALKCR